MNPGNSVIHEIYQYMNEKGILISYLGDFNHTIVNSLLSSVKKIINATEIDFQSKKRFYAVVAECLDNVNKYNYKYEGSEQEPNKTFFNILESKEAFIIQTGNYMESKSAPELTAKLDKVNSLDKEGLKAFYHDKLAESPAKGGGLGIIDISIRSGCKINYEIKPVSDNLLFFILQTTIKK